jgi:polyhydroxyalkanoate synthase
VALFADTDLTYALAEGGHNGGIVSEPGGRADTGYQLMTRRHGERYMDPDSWAAVAPRFKGPGGRPGATGWRLQAPASAWRRPGMGAPQRGFAPLEPAPGRYVHMR